MIMMGWEEEEEEGDGDGKRKEEKGGIRVLLYQPVCTYELLRQERLNHSKMPLPPNLLLSKKISSPRLHAGR